MYSKKLVFICAFSAILFSVTSFGEYACSDYPDKDLIILLDESDNNVTHSDYLQNSDLPEGWSIASQEMLSDGDVKDYLIKNDLIVPKDYYDGVLSSVYWEKIQAGPNMTAYVTVETINDSQRANKIYEKLLDAYRDSRGAIINFETSTKYGQKGFAGRFKRDDYIIYFLDSKNRMIYVYGLNESDVKYVADGYNHLKNSLIVTESHHWKAKVCKSGTDACTQTLYFSSVYDSFQLKNCTTVHGGKDIPCPKDRFEEFSNSIKIPFASCEKDDIIELSYEKRSEFPMNNRFWSSQDFYFENGYPSDKLVFTLTVPEEIEINHFATQGVNPTVTKQSGRKSFIWEKESVPPFESEGLMPPEREVIARAGYSSILSWDDIKEWNGKLFQDSMNKDVVKEKVDSITSGSTTDDEKIKRIYEWVRDNIRYEENEMGFLTGYKPHKCEEILNYKFGDCKDHTVILVSMLDAAGIKSYPVVVGRDSINMDTPSPYEFYHSIVAVPKDGRYIWLDPTCSYCPYGYLASEEQGADALMLLNPETSFTKTPVDDADKNFRSDANYTIVLGTAGDAQINVSFEITGSFGLGMKEELKDAKEEKVKETIAVMVKSVCPEFELAGHRIINDSEKILKMELNVKCAHYATKSENKLVYNIPADSIYSELISKEKRRFPIVKENNEAYSSTQSIELPKGYAVSMLPEEYSAKESFASYDYECHEVSGNIVCTDVLIEKQTSLPTSEYALFSDYYKSINSLKRSIILIPSEEAKTDITQTTQSTITTEPENKGTNPVKENSAQNNGTGGFPTSNVLMAVIIVLLLAVIGILLTRKKGK